MIDDVKTCDTCSWQHHENRMWCNNCERNRMIPQWPYADNFDFWQEVTHGPKDIDSTESAQAKPEAE